MIFKVLFGIIAIGFLIFIADIGISFVCGLKFMACSDFSLIEWIFNTFKEHVGGWFG